MTLADDTGAEGGERTFQLYSQDIHQTRFRE
jgi:hypothetical protein